VQLATKEQRRLFDFSMRLSLKRPVPPVTVGGAASAPASGVPAAAAETAAPAKAS
jgi:type IV pilus assembly protein PilN